MTILEQLAAHARQRVAADREANSLDVLQAPVSYTHLTLPTTSRV